MKAAMIEQCGVPPRPLERGDPDPGEGQALVRLTAAPITPLDLLCASGTSYWGIPQLPYVPGVQGVGEVIDGTVLRAGDLVWFPTTAGIMPGDGSMAELVVVDEHRVVSLPAGLSSVAAAALGLSAVAALLALTTTGDLRPGECVIVLGAGGAVGQSALQLARHFGAARVVGVVHSPASRVRAAATGADVVIDVSQTDGPDGLTSALRNACEGGADLVIDPVFGAIAVAAVSTLRPRGRLVQLGSASSETAEFDSATIRSRCLSILGYTNAALSAEQTAAALTTVFELGAEGALSVDHEEHPLAQVEAAWASQLSGAATRRLILTPSGA
jgi:NADPH:quinone reductase